MGYIMVIVLVLALLVVGAFDGACEVVIAPFC